MDGPVAGSMGWPGRTASRSLRTILLLRGLGPGPGERLDHLEALELGVAERQRAVLGGAGVGAPERLGAGPGLERRPRGPHGMGRVEDVVLALRPAQHVELHEAVDGVEVTLAAEPHGLELLRRVLAHPEAIHGDEHGRAF